MTEITIRALKIIRDKKPLDADGFARLMWPDSDMHRRVSNQGHGATRGKAAWLCGGSYLGRLRKMGLVVVNYTHERRHLEPVARLTAEAEKLLSVDEP